MKRFIFTLILCFLASVSFGADYFLDVDCLTPGTGTSPTCVGGGGAGPYTNFTSFIGANNLAADDSVDGQLKTYAEDWVIDGSGSAGQPVVIKNATINASGETNGVNLIDFEYITLQDLSISGATNRNIRVDGAGTSKNIIISDCVLGATSGAPSVSLIDTTTAALTTLTITGGGTTGIGTLRCINSTFDEINSQANTSHGIELGDTSTGNTLTDCISSLNVTATSHGYYINSSANNTLVNCTAIGNSGNGATFNTNSTGGEITGGTFNSNTDGVAVTDDDVDITGATINSNSDKGVDLSGSDNSSVNTSTLDGNDAGITVNNGDNFSATGTTITNSASGVGIGFTGDSSAATVTRCTVTGNAGDGSSETGTANDITYRGLWSELNGDDGGTAHTNNFDINHWYGVYLDNVNSGLAMINDSTGTLYNNTIVTNGTDASGRGGIYIQDTSTWIVKNNIVVSDGVMILADVDDATATATFENNCYWVDDDSLTLTQKKALLLFKIDGVAKNWAQWQAAGYDTTASGSIFVDPLFVDFDNDNFKLTQSSPCVNTGVYISAVHSTADQGDITGTFVFPIAGQINMGAYQTYAKAGSRTIVVAPDNPLFQDPPFVDAASDDFWLDGCVSYTQ